MTTSRAQRYESLVRKSLAEKGLDPVAAHVGCEKTTISRMQNEHLGKFCRMLESLDLKVVPTKFKCYPADEVNYMFALAKKYIAQMETPEELDFD